MANIFTKNLISCSYAPTFGYNGFFAYNFAPMQMTMPTPMPFFNIGSSYIMPQQTSGNIFTRRMYRALYNTGGGSSPKINNTPQKTSETKSTADVKKVEKPKPKPKAKVQHKVTTPVSRDLRADFTNTAYQYMGFNEADGSSRIISKSGEWCADFIKYVINETYRDKGLTPPTSDLRIEPGLPHLRVENIKQWGIRHGNYLSVANKSNKAQTIAEKVKKGDIIILRENGASHTGFVTKVYSDGSFDSIEGNRDDRVKTAHYKASDPSLSGFVQLKS